MRRIFIFVLSFILLFGLVIMTSPDNSIQASDLGIVEDSGDVGLFHKLTKINNENRAYVYFRFYSVLSGITSSISETDDGSLDTPNDEFVDENAHFTVFSRFPSWNIDGSSSERVINAPNGFDKLSIIFDPFANDYPSNPHPTQYFNFTNITTLRIIMNGIGYPTKWIVIYDQNNVELYSYNPDKTEAGDISIYWSGNDNIPDDNFIVDVGSDYSKLPIMKYDFWLFDSIVLKDSVSKTYIFQINLNGSIYKFDLIIPETIDINKFKNQDGAYNISFSSVNNERIIYMQPDLTKSPTPITRGTVATPADLLVGFITINLDTLKFDEVKKLSLSTIINKEENSKAFMYVFLPMKIEKVLTIHINYEYRYQYAWGVDYGSWKTKDYIYVYGDKQEQHFPWWNWAGFIIDPLVNTNVEEITKISPSEIPANVSNQYVTLLKGNLNDLNNLSLHKIFLGQYNSSFLSTDYDIQNSSVIDITYLSEGIIYYVPFENIDQKNVDPEPTKGLFDDLNNFIDIIKLIFKLILVIICLAIFLPIIKIIFGIIKAFIPKRWR